MVIRVCKIKPFACVTFFLRKFVAIKHDSPCKLCIGFVVRPLRAGRNDNEDKPIVMRKYILLFCMALMPALMMAQSLNEIKNSGKYLWGEGMAESYSDADRQALRHLVESISVNVESSFTNVIDNVNSEGKTDSKMAMQAVMKTYSQATLTNTKVITLSQEPDAHVIRYVSVDDVAKIFEARKQKAIDFINLAQKAEERLKIDDVLRYYYWSYCLVTSLPDTMQPKTPERFLLRTWIPDRINEVFKGIKVQKQKVEDEFVTLLVTYKDRPVASLDYTYYDGSGYTNIYSATDGLGVMEMQPGIATDNLKIKCEYEYLGEAQFDRENAAVVEVMKGLNFRNAYINVGGDNQAIAEMQPVTLTALTTQETETVMPLSFVSEEETTSMEDIMGKVLEAVKAKNYKSVEQYFTPEGREMFHKLLNYGNARILEEPQLTYIRKGDETICRSIPMSFSFKNNKRKFVESVCFTFDAENKINCVAFSLGEEAVADILKHTDYSENARVVLTQFLENYKTAFALKRLDYIESIFDDNALIITGTVVKRTEYKNQEERTRYLDNPIIKYNRFDKKTYINHLRRTFASNEFVNIRFANNDVVKAGGSYGEVYGIQIKQDYYSTNYGDTGYLFLCIDLNDPENPIIKVRTWQPDRDPDFGLYGLGNF